MNKSPKLSVVIPTRRGAPRLGDLLVSILRQQAPPPFEVLVVANTSDEGVKQMVLGLGSRFRYYCTNKPGVNIARNFGLNEARGEVVLFLDDDCFLEEPLFLKRHFDLHHKHPYAIGVGGRYTMKRRATAVEQAYHWIYDHRLSSSKIDAERTTNLLGGNASFKTVALKTAFRFNDAIVFGGADIDLNVRLVLAGQTLLFSERLGVEHRLDLGPLAFLKNGFLHGRASQLREASQLSLHWRFQGARQTLASNMEERGLYPSGLVRLFFAAYDFAFRAGSTFAKRQPETPVPGYRIFFEVMREFVLKIRKFPSQRTLSEIENALKFSISKH